MTVQESLWLYSEILMVPSCWEIREPVDLPEVLSLPYQNLLTLGENLALGALRCFLTARWL